MLPWKLDAAGRELIADDKVKQLIKAADNDTSVTEIALSSSELTDQCGVVLGNLLAKNRTLKRLK